MTAPDLAALTDAARNLDSTVTAYMLGEAGGAEVAQAQARVRRIVHRVLTASADRCDAGVALIAAERERQVDVEGWTPDHDAEHTAGDLARAAACYALPEAWRTDDIWPWHPGWWKPSPDDRIRELVKAGALLAAEIDRLQAKDGSR